MSISASALRKLAALNLSSDQMAGVLDVLADLAAADEERKAMQRDRTRRHREKRDGNVTVTSSERDAPPSDKENTPTPPKEITSPHSDPKGSSFAPAKSEIDQAIEAYSTMAAKAGLAVPRAITPARRQKVAAKLKAHGIAVWLEAVSRLGTSEFCTGKNDRGWRADLDFLLQDKSFLGLIEGKYGGASGGHEAADVFCADENQQTRLHVIRFRNEHDGADPPRSVQGGKAGYLIPASWVKAMQMRMQANG